ncbi:MAG: Hsp33 family molecular chaperone HslO [Oscillospiraceae bacterium]|nr:Hsp33 family molecular chaperone HslO [Eubacteriales bacterium]MDY2618004.1 Hsp33 family molecular chaperone HslO [Oscillospiraceae bacterium]
MGEIVRIMTTDGFVMASAITGTDIVARAQEIHHTSPTATAALGRSLLACSMMGNQLKGADNSLTLQIRGDGPLGGITCVSDSEGNVRGYVNNPAADVPRKQEGKLDVGGAVGSGSLTVIKDLGLKDPYVGSIALVSGEIAEDVTAYFAESEQIPNACALGVLVRKDSGAVITAGGYLIQLLPGAGEDVIEKVERGIRKVGYVTGRLSEGESALDLVREVLGEFEIEVLETCPVEYRCYCTRDRVVKALVSMGSAEMRSLIDEQGSAELTCQFCDVVYKFSREDLEQIYRDMQPDKA